MSVTNSSSWKSFDLNCYTSAKMSWKNAREWEVSLYCYRSQTRLYISNVCFAFLFLLTAFHLGVLHDGFCILTVADWESGKYREKSMRRKSFLGVTRQNSSTKFFFEYIWCTAYIYISCIYLYYVVLEDSLLQKGAKLGYLFCLPLCYYLADVIYVVFACLNYIHEPIEKAIFGYKSEFTCWKLVIGTLEQFAKFYCWFCTGKWWLGDLNKLILIKLIFAKKKHFVVFCRS